MFNKYRFPFLLLGAGIGIIITNAIYIFNPNIEYKEYTEEEIIAEATDLGMVFIKDNIDISPKKEEIMEKAVDKSEVDEKKEIHFIIEYGDSLEKVSKGLYELGIIDDIEEFNKFSKDKKVDKKLRVGTYTLLPNLDNETLIKIFTKIPQ